MTRKNEAGSTFAASAGREEQLSQAPEVAEPNPDDNIALTAWGSEREAYPGEVVTSSWPNLIQAFESRETAEKGGEAFTPAAVKPCPPTCRCGGQVHRLGANVERLSMLVLDLDKAESGAALSERDVENALGALGGVHFLAYSTWSHRPEAWKIRVVVPLSRSISPDENRTLRAFLRERLRIPDDPSVRDPARLFYAPQHPPGTTPFRRVNEPRGSFGLPVDGLLHVAATEGVTVAVREARAAPPANRAALVSTSECIDLAPLRTILERSSSLPIRDMLAGKPLPASGHDDALNRLAGALAFTLPLDTPWEGYLELIRPTLEATPCEKGIEHHVAEFRDQLERARGRKADADAEAAATAAALRRGLDAPAEREELKLGADLAVVATQAEDALVRADAEIFARGESLVRVVTDEVDAAQGMRTRVARLRSIDVVHMRDVLSRYLRCVKYNKRDGAYTDASPPKELAETLLARVGEWRFRKVTGVITTPSLRPDGTVLAEGGYDAATGLYLVAPPAMPPIGETRAEAEGALALLLDLLAEFPFIDNVSRSIALSGLITPVVRGALPAAPGHAASASTPGTGKSYLWDVAAAIVTGRPCPVIAAARSEEENEKRLGAALIGGQPLMNLDNVSGGLQGDFLCQAVERPIVEVRILGRSEKVSVESRATIFATGNNLALHDDLTRRFLVCRLDADMERPELRQFRARPVALVQADRGRYVAAAMTIVRAYIMAGRPNPAPRLASFEGWSDAVRSSLMWLGQADPCGSMDAARAEDPVTGQLGTLLQALKAYLGVGAGSAVTAPELVKRAELGGIARGMPEGLLTALKEVALDARGQWSPRVLGKWLARHKDRIVGGLRLRARGGTGGHALSWWVE